MLACNFTLRKEQIGRIIYKEICTRICSNYILVHKPHGYLLYTKPHSFFAAVSVSLLKLQERSVLNKNQLLQYRM
jgi:hypothetical protein